VSGHRNAAQLRDRTAEPIRCATLTGLLIGSLTRLTHRADPPGNSSAGPSDRGSAARRNPGGRRNSGTTSPTVGFASSLSTGATRPLRRSRQSAVD
jgi:hypothetical protein